MTTIFKNPTNNIRNATAIITHGGKAHRDDFLSCAIAVALSSNWPVIYRRDPTAEEMENPWTTVLDVGGRQEPEKSNYDHHQLPRDAAPQCAFTLLIEALNLRGFEVPWVKSTATMDAKGPFALARELGIDAKVLLDLQSPVEGVLLEMFEMYDELLPGDALYEIMHRIGIRLINAAGARADRQAHLSERVHLANVGAGGVEVLILEEKDNAGLQEWRDRHAPTAGICITRDDRGPGWCLYRFNDDTRVDFSRLEGVQGVIFAHKGGFIAKTEEMHLEKVLCLADMGTK